MTERNVHGILTFSGFMISVLTIFYFATEYIPPLSPWSRIAALILLAIGFAAFGYFIQSTAVGGPFFDVDRMRWLRPSNMFYLLAIVAVVIADGLFIFDIEDLARPLKVLVSLGVGIGLVFAAARMRKGAPAAE